MKKSLLFVALCAVATIMTGCLTTNTNDATAVAQFKVAPKVYQADIVTGKKAVSAEVTVYNVLGLISWGVTEFADDAFVSSAVVSPLPIKLLESPEDAAKKGATFKACAENKADAIIAAKYKLDIANFFVYKTVKAKVTGYPATIKGVK